METYILMQFFFTWWKIANPSNRINGGFFLQLSSSLNPFNKIRFVSKIVEFAVFLDFIGNTTIFGTGTLLSQCCQLTHNCFKYIKKSFLSNFHLSMASFQFFPNLTFDWSGHPYNLALKYSFGNIQSSFRMWNLTTFHFQ